ncbi:MAG: exodeoxyribonuclease V subunit beta [Arsenophonus sp.]
MKNKIIETHELDPYYLPLYGKSLIEASAGTGKTYTISLLYLRLLLGIGEKNAFFRRLNVEEILVVTFGQSSINELKSRIRHNIHQMKIACIRNGIGFNENSIYRTLLSFISNRDLAYQWLLLAERKMNEAPIYTIHSFCQHILTYNIFESGILFEQTIINDEYNLQKQACIDFWRRYCYPLNYSMSTVIIDEWSDPDTLLIEIKPYLQGDIPSFINRSIKSQSIKKRHKILIDAIKIVKKLWLLNSMNFIDLISNSDVNKRNYNRHNLLDWLSSITIWAKSKTLNYKIPKELVRFSQSELINKTPTGNIVKHDVFLAIDNLLQQSFTLRDLFISKAIINIRQAISKEKKKRGEIGFDDLLSNLDKALHTKNGNKLANEIRNRYPIVMIDEFQDTNPQQYRIFQNIYHGHDHCGLLFIGDPKQAIYAFRGADIFTYLKAKNQIKFHYTINTNWRSSSSMVDAINQLFSLTEKPFLFEQIPFKKINSVSDNQDLEFIYKTKKITALNFCYIDKESISMLDYQQTMAYHCASTICNWLKESENGTAWLSRNNIKKSITALDIMVLVRNRHEALIIQKSLSKFNIPSVFLSNKDSVFTTDEAQDLFWLLQAMLFPEKICTLRCALGTRLMGLSAQDIEQLNNDENYCETIIEEFLNYSLIWKKNGIFRALRIIMVNHRIAENLLMDNMEGERRLMNVMHLSELLQEAELQLHGKHDLVRWLERQINQPNPLLENQQIRLQNDKNLICISTIHKAKGLEYPIVWLPFTFQLFHKKLITFHDRKNFEISLDLTQQKESIRLANEEYLSEDLRLLYVALTRSIYHCSVGIGSLKNDCLNWKNSCNDLHRTALNYLLQKGQFNKNILLRNSLLELVSENISITFINDINLSPFYPKENKPIKLLARYFRGNIKDTWKVTSYSGLNYHDIDQLSDKFSVSDINIEIHILKSLVTKIGIDEKKDNLVTQDEISDNNMSIHTFPKGKTAGILLHSLLESLPFDQHPKEFWLSEKLEKVGFSTNWASVLKMWLINIFDTPLIKDNISLSKIRNNFKLNEMEFHLSIEKLLLPSVLDRLTHKYDLLSQNCPSLTFEPVNGIIKGYIDLVFYWKDKFYIVDYKSNWLGKNSFAYNQMAIKSLMIDNRYDLQYQLYTLAFHRYLKNRLPNYTYQKDFGGVIYFFLRGVNTNYPNSSIYHTIPSYELINGMDNMFSSFNRG